MAVIVVDKVADEVTNDLTDKVTDEVTDKVECPKGSKPARVRGRWVLGLGLVGPGVRASGQPRSRGPAGP